MFFSKNNSNSDNRSQELEAVKQELQESKKAIAELRGIKSAMPDPYYVRDMDYNITHWPDSIAKLTGYSEVEAKKLKCYEIFRAGVCPPNGKCPTQNCVGSKQFLRDVAVDVYNRNGKIIHSLVSNAGVYNEEGKPIGAVEVVKDNNLVQETMNIIGETIKKIDFASNNLSSAMENVTGISQKVAENTHESLVDIKKGTETSSVVSNKAGESTKYAGSAQESLEGINKSMSLSVEKISALKAKSTIVIEFIKVIQDIAKKTDLLAINASIEAAHAGDAGLGFKVIADDIRELSKSSEESVVSIQTTIHEINDLIAEAIESINITEKDVESGTNNISELLTFVNDIAISVKEQMITMQTVENTAGVTSEVVEEQNKSVAEVRGVGNELSDIAKKLTYEFEVLFKAIQHKDM